MPLATSAKRKSAGAQSPKASPGRRIFARGSDLDTLVDGDFVGLWSDAAGNVDAEQVGESLTGRTAFQLVSGLLAHGHAGVGHRLLDLLLNHPRLSPLLDGTLEQDGTEGLDLQACLEDFLNEERCSFLESTYTILAGSGIMLGKSTAARPSCNLRGPSYAAMKSKTLERQFDRVTESQSSAGTGQTCGDMISKIASLESARGGQADVVRDKMHRQSSRLTKNTGGSQVMSTSSAASAARRSMLAAVISPHTSLSKSSVGPLQVGSSPSLPGVLAEAKRDASQSELAHLHMSDRIVHTTSQPTIGELELVTTVFTDCSERPWTSGQLARRTEPRKSEDMSITSVEELSAVGAHGNRETPHWAVRDESVDSELPSREVVKVQSEGRHVGDQARKCDADEQDEANDHYASSGRVDEASSDDESESTAVWEPSSVQAAASRRSVRRSVIGETAVRFAKRPSVAMSMVWDANVQEDHAEFLATSSHRCMLHPSSPTRMTWDVVLLFVILFEAIVLPLGICFNLNPPAILLWSATAFFVIDIMLNCVTGFYHNGVIVMRQDTVFKRYVFSWFLVDFVSTMPWSEIFFNSEFAESSGMLRFAKISKLLRVLRLLHVLKLKGLLTRIEEMISSYVVLFMLAAVKTLVSFLLLIHWVACVWGYIGGGSLIDDSKGAYDMTGCEPDGPCEGGIGLVGSPWIKRYGLESMHAWERYTVALQYATGLMAGADLPIATGLIGERLYTVAMTIIGFMICSVIISHIVVVMDGISKDNSEYLEEARAIRDFMVSRGMPLQLQTKVKRYLDYQFKHRKVVHQNHSVMMKLSPQLRLEIQEQMNRSTLELHPFFRNMESNILSEVCSLCTCVIYAPDDVVMRKGNTSCSIVFLVRGQVQIQDVRPDFSVHLRPPAWIGDRGLFVESARNHNVVCTQHSELLTIRQQDLLELAAKFTSAQTYIKDFCKRVLDEDPSVIFCEYCYQVGHDLEGCRKLTALALANVRNKRASNDMDKELETGGIFGAFKHLLPVPVAASKTKERKRSSITTSAQHLSRPNNGRQYDAWNGEM